jgi:hypothetical protein
MKIIDIFTKKKWIFYVIIACIGIIISFIFYKRKDISYLDYENYENEFAIVKPNVPKKYRNYKKTEHKCRKIIEDILKRPFSSVRPDFLKYPKTGRNLELDMYNKELNLAFEYQGLQHRKFTPFFHSCYKDFTNQLERDEFKKNKCKELGIRLIEIPDTIKNDNLYQFINDSIKEI